MKQMLGFDLQYNYLEKQTFIQCFASVYTYMEMQNNRAGVFSEPDIGGHCVGCGSGGPLHHCKKDSAAKKRCAFFALFNTMCGNSSLRRRFDGMPTDMQKLIGDTDAEGKGCGSDFTVDFLFGYAGYAFRLCDDAASFRAEIIASINAGVPVIAKTKSGEEYHVIIGYDGENLIIPRVMSYNFATNPPTLNPESTPGYGELERIYIFGGKTARRYTLKHGLHNIRRVMSYNISAGLWDQYLTKLGGCAKYPSGDGLYDADSAERKVRARHLAETNLYMYNICSFAGAFCCAKMPNHYLHMELTDPALSPLWDDIDDPHGVILNAGHKTGILNRERIWEIEDPGRIAALSEEICDEIAKAMQADIRLLEIIDRALEIVEA